MATDAYVTNFTLLVKAYESCDQDWVNFGQFKSHLDKLGIDYSRLHTFKRSDEEPASHNTLLSRFFHCWIDSSSRESW